MRESECLNHKAFRSLSPCIVSFMMIFTLTLRWGHDHDPICMQMDEVLASTSEQIKNFAVVYLVDVSQVPVSAREKGSSKHWKLVGGW